MTMTATAIAKVSGWPAAVEVFAAQTLKNLRMASETSVKRFGADERFPNR
jgi:hypothetical protein